MPEQVIDQAYTGYWEAYDLHEDPFSEVDESYTSSHWHEYLELLQHLSLYSNVMLAVTGEEDAGRNLFLSQFNVKINMHIDTHFIKADAYFDHNALLDTIVDAYSFAGIGSNSSDFSDRATSLLTNIERSEKSLLLVVDNAHLLSASTLEAILFFVKEQPADNALLHVVLFGDLELQSKLSNLEHQTDSENFIHAIELELYSPEETERYLRHKVNQAGTEAVFPFSNQDILQIHKMSEGYLRRIDRFARDLLLERTSKESHVVGKRLTKSKWFSTTLISVAIVATGFGWYRLHTIGNPYKPGDKPGHFIPQSISSLPETLLSKLRQWTHLGGGQKDSHKAGEPKLASLLDPNVTAVDDGQAALEDKLEQIRKQEANQTAENEAVQHRISQLIQSHASDDTGSQAAPRPKKLEAVESIAAKQQRRKEALIGQLSPKIEPAKTPVAITQTRVVAEKAETLPQQTQKNHEHAAARLDEGNVQTRRVRSSAHLKSRQRVAAKEQPVDILDNDDTFGADEISDYDRELDKLKQVSSLENPEEAAMIDKVVSVPDVKRDGSVVRRARPQARKPKIVSIKAQDGALSAASPRRDEVVSYDKYGSELSATHPSLVSASGDSKKFAKRSLSKRQGTTTPGSDKMFNLIKTVPKHAEPQTARLGATTTTQARGISTTDSGLPTSTPTIATVGRKMGPPPTFNDLKKATNETARVNTIASLPSVQSRATTKPVLSTPSDGLSSHYTLQLVGGHDKSNVLNFVRAHALSKSETRIIKSQRGGKTWYIVMYGNYDSVDQAKQAIKHLPAPVRNLNPWIREEQSVSHAHLNQGKHSG